MIAVDTNILVYAHRPDSRHHRVASRVLRDLGRSQRWAVPWPCVHEFFAVMSNPRMPGPVSRDATVAALDALLAHPTVVMLGETRQHWPLLRDLVRAASLEGPKIHDAKIAAICLGHDVDELWTADRDFSYFPALRTRNPLVA